MFASRFRRAVIAAALSCAAAAGTAAETVLTVLTHSSFSASKEVLAVFEAETGTRLRFVEGGDAGETLGKAILSKGNPFADVIFGIDSTFLGRALAADIFEPLGIPVPPTIPTDLRLDPTSRLAPVDVGYVCLNADKAWFVSRGLALPARLEDLVLPVNRGLLVVEDPAASSPGLAFLPPPSPVSAKPEITRGSGSGGICVPTTCSWPAAGATPTTTSSAPPAADGGPSS